MPREPHTQLRQWDVGDRIATTVHRIDNDGEETIELTGVNERLELSIEERGHEMVLPQRARVRS